MKQTLASLLIALPALLFLSSCATAPDPNAQIPGQQVVVSIEDQKMVLMKDNVPVKYYDIATSKYGVGSGRGTYKTPTGHFVVESKVGAGAQEGTVFKACKATKEVLPVNAPGRDAIVTRVMTLRGLDSNNKNALARGIFIHGTPEERNIGKPSSYGCVRMRSKDVVDLFDRLGPGTPVVISESSINHEVAIRKPMEIKKPRELPDMPASDTLIASTTPGGSTSINSRGATGPSTTTVASMVDQGSNSTGAIPNGRNMPAQMGHTTLNSAAMPTAAATPAPISQQEQAIIANAQPQHGHSRTAAAAPAPASASPAGYVPTPSPQSVVSETAIASTAATSQPARKSPDSAAKKSDTSRKTATTKSSAEKSTTTASSTQTQKPRKVATASNTSSSGVNIDTAAPALTMTPMPPPAPAPSISPTPAPVVSHAHSEPVRLSSSTPRPRRVANPSPDSSILEAEAKLVNRSTVP
ncbi:MAG: L,D-transpeptidase [Candidatus Methylacidiphilales bacterium]|nr:L,D-transpeptidase [Candidatus Methylacidiphilales bacterium]